MWVQRYTKTLKILALSCLLLLLVPATTHAAINAAPIPPPVSGSYGLEATKKQPPPTQGATITVPGSGASFSTSPITVSGLCPNDLLVQVYNNGVLMGSTPCKSGSFSVQVSLFSGQNELYALVFDNLDQVGPESNKITVNFNDANFTAFGSLITLTSNYGRRSANPGTTLNWPLILSGGTGPYAFSINWGDGKNDLKSQSIAGDVNISHVYDKAGVYQVTVKVTDVNGATAFLQVVAIARGNVGTASDKDATPKTTAASGTVLWQPAALALLFLFPTFWLGRRSELVTLHKKLERDAAKYQEQENK